MLEKLMAAQERIAELEADNARLKTVMVAAAEEIHEHWDAHCDAEGYGPANLMRRLEEGISSEYGYTAGRFAELQADVTDPEEFAREIVRLLNEETEDGHSIIHEMLDNVFVEAIEYGCEGVDHDFQQATTLQGD